VRDIDATLRATVNQCLAINRAMRAIRSVTPAARLITCEDIGKTFATPELQYQADHENERRWLSFDLLAGKVVPGHHF
jgi:dTDP-4-dehydrorhamnose reductase